MTWENHLPQGTKNAVKPPSASEMLKTLKWNILREGDLFFHFHSSLKRIWLSALRQYRWICQRKNVELSLYRHLDDTVQALSRHIVFFCHSVNLQNGCMVLKTLWATRKWTTFQLWLLKRRWIRREKKYIGKQIIWQFPCCNLAAQSATTSSSLLCVLAAPMGAVTQLHAFTTEGNTLVSRLQHKGMYNSAKPIVGLGSALLLKIFLWCETTAQTDSSWKLSAGWPRATESPPDCHLLGKSIWFLIPPAKSQRNTRGRESSVTV